MFSVPTVEHVRNVPHFEAIAKRRTLSIAQRLIQDNGRGRAIFYGNEHIGKQRTVTTPAPPFEKAFAMARPVRVSSLQIRIEQPAKLAVSRGAATCETA
jgi:hypothetical protein